LVDCSAFDGDVTFFAFEVVFVFFAFAIEQESMLEH
jgi:hypothetical protein